MKKFLIAGPSLAAVAAAGSAGAVDVTLGGSIEMGIEYGLGKKVDGFMFVGSKAYQSVSLSIAAAGTTDAGMKFGGSFALSTADELKLDLYDTNGTVAGGKKLVKVTNSDGSAKIAGAAYNVSGGAKVDASQIVSVKINSAWQGAKDTTTGHRINMTSIAGNSDVCKIAGIASASVSNAIARSNATAVAQLISISSGAYLPAGRLTADGLSVTAMNSKVSENIAAVLNNGAGANGTKADATFQVGFAADPDAYAANATVYAGPYMEVKLTSSTTKMVVGAVCVTNEFKASETAAYLNLASRVMQVGAASIYIEGGFGRLTLQQGDYAGKVASIGSAGDQATISSTGLVAILEGASLMGMNGYAAVDVGSIKAGSRPNYMLGTTIDLMGLSVAVEIEDEATTTTVVTNTGGTAGTQDENKYIDHWDMGTSYTLGDMQIDGVLDSAGDWALKASGSVAGFTATSIIENVKKGQNKKAGLSIDTTLATSFNGINVSIGLDEDLEYSLSGSYSIGNSGLAITAAYSSEDNGGKVSAKLSF